MKSSPGEIENSLTLLAETLRRSADASAGLDDARLHFAPDKRSWSASDILVHLRSCADLWTHSIYAMLAGKMI